MKKRNILAGLLIALGLTACYDLDKMPEGELSTATPFQTLGEMQSYMNLFYESGLRGQGFAAGGNGGIAGNDAGSDNIAGSISTRLTGNTALSTAGSLNYGPIRNVNFFLTNIALDSTNPDYNHYVGEAFYFRAWYYYQLLINYGGVAWVDVPLNPDMAEMAIPRESRSTIADYILADLDNAIQYLHERSNNSTMRLHKDVARALKSEVALFEGTWEKYHKAEGDAFYDPSITDEKINNYFQQAIDAAQAVMNRGVWQIHNTGNVNNDYRIIFQTTNLAGNQEILWFKKYDGDNVGNGVNRYLNSGGGAAGITASLVDDYLTRDGRPFVGAERLAAKRVYGEELDPAVRDPRLAQTVCMPGQTLRPDNPNGFVVPPLNGSAFNQNISGYSILKHVQIDYTGSLDSEFGGATPAIQFRYADVLLNYAEALAEQNGAANANKIIEALRPLRQRAGMPDVDFDREYNTESDYPFRNLDKYIQAVRRERRIEKACEGRRLEDILRWAAADELIVGQWPRGALFVGSNLEGHPQYGDALRYDQPADNNLFLTGKPGDAERYIIPVNPANYPNGWQFKVNRDYLLPLNTTFLERMEKEVGVPWEQNPGWE